MNTEVIKILIELFFPYFRWTRRIVGGHWELWYVDFPVCSYIWHHVERCSKETGDRPSGLCRGNCECEDHDPTGNERMVLA